MTIMNRSRRKAPRFPIGTPVHTAYEYALLLIGSFLVAVSFNLFMEPNRIASGGVSGISVIVRSLIGVEPAITQWLLNIPLFIAGIALLGGKFGLKTAVGTAVLPLFVLLTDNWAPLTDNPLLATLFGGLGIGAGLGIVFRGRGSTGGLDLAAQIVAKYTGLGLGLSVALLDGFVILTAGFVFSPEQALYALIGLFVTTKTIDVVQIGFSTSKVAYIISEDVESIARTVLYDLDRGLTRLTAHGGYTGQAKTVLMVVVSQTEVTKLKALVQAADPQAFVIITGATEVLGEGFKVQ
ncbi:YitT family protein [Paenibacillus alkalitolerans]|uniref:YitT family protein n=1 Tax=Paenibacillus alkalitolerans TaxID=2799335 RepID=UPI0018F5F704|nr:YitT family protein [Paenibacillus alkalitolerans]